MINTTKGINYSIGFGNQGLLYHLFFRKGNIIEQDLLFIRDKLNCKNIRIFGSNMDKLIIASKASLNLGILPWLSPRFIDSDFETTKKMFKLFCIKAKNNGLGDEPLFVANEFVLDCSDLLDKKIDSWSRRTNVVLNKLKTGKVFDVTDKVEILFKTARKCGWKGPLSYASFMYEIVDWESIDDDNFMVAKNLYWENDSKTGAPETPEFYEEKVKKLIKEAAGKNVVISEYGAVPHKDSLAAGGGGFMLRGNTDYNAQKDALIKYFDVFKKINNIISFLYCFENKTRNPESSFGIINRKNMNILTPAAQKFAEI